MTGNRSQFMNFVSKFMGTFKFRNDHIARIIRYGDYQLGNVTISRVYYIEGLGHNLFSVGQFCDADLEVAFRKNTCFIRNLEGVDLLFESRDTNLHTISFDDMLKTSPKLNEFYENVGISDQTSVARTPQQNSIVERRNRTLVEAARTMVLKNKARLVASGFRQEKGINFEESFAPDNPSHVYKLKKALYGLKQAPRAWYDMLSSFFISQHFSKGAVDSTLFTQKAGNDLLLVQIYYDDIILASTNTAMSIEFANLMNTKFKMSIMGQMSFFLGLQISYSPKGIFINQSKYASRIVKKYGILTRDSVDTPMVEKSKQDEDLHGKPVNATLYHGMIGFLMYLTSSGPGLIYDVCLCAWYQAKPIEKHLNVVKQIF
uniref:Uncharacterized protein n=1 Tax=Tanacetum cinerariifolium TaxID=118510 RepID=A0A6L2NNT1_TANCI|nr:hypothetical protein [Tanacetum cinerariifolium]